MSISDPADDGPCAEACETFRKSLLRPRRKSVGGFVLTSIGLLFVALVPLYFAMAASHLVPNEGIARGISQTPATAQKLYAAEIRFGAVLVPFTGLLILCLVAQLRGIRRHWFYLWHDLDRQAAKAHAWAMIWVPFVAFFIFLAVLLAAWPLLDLPGTLEDTLPVAGSVSEWSVGYWAGAILAAMVITLAFVTLIATSTLSGHYPAARDVDPIFLAFESAKQSLGEDREPKDVLAKFFFEDGDYQKDLRPRFKDPSYIASHAPVSSVSMTPEAASGMIRGLIVALGVVLVVGLLVLALGLELLKLNVGGSVEYQAAVGLAGDAWLQCLGIGCSILLFVAYGFPTARLAPYVEAAKTIKPKESTGGTRLMFKKVEKLLGANEKNLAIILQAANHGGGFQETLNATLSSRIATVLGLLAPAAMSGVLSLLG